MTIAKLPLAKDIEEFDFTSTPINEGLVKDLATGSFVADQCNVVLVGGTGTGKTHLAIAIARALIRNGTRGRFFNVVDLVNRLEPRPAPANRAGWPNTSRVWTSSSSTNSATCPSRNPVASCCST
jgi:DNA replication protein